MRSLTSISGVWSKMSRLTTGPRSVVGPSSGASSTPGPAGRAGLLPCATAHPAAASNAVTIASKPSTSPVRYLTWASRRRCSLSLAVYSIRWADVISSSTWRARKSRWNSSAQLTQWVPTPPDTPQPNASVTCTRTCSGPTGAPYGLSPTSSENTPTMAGPGAKNANPKAIWLSRLGIADGIWVVSNGRGCSRSDSTTA